MEGLAERREPAGRDGRAQRLLPELDDLERAETLYRRVIEEHPDATIALRALDIEGVCVSDVG